MKIEIVKTTGSNMWYKEYIGIQCEVLSQDVKTYKVNLNGEGDILKADCKIIFN